MVLNRPLRLRKRKLPPPPGQQIPAVELRMPQPVESPKVPTPNTIPQSNLIETPTIPKDLPDTPIPSKNLSESYSPPSESYNPPSELPPLPSIDQEVQNTAYSSDIEGTPPTWKDYQKSMQEAVSKEKGKSTELLDELADVIAKGIDTKLEKVDMEHLESEKDIDYATILKNQFDKATNDYFEAGRKFQEAGLFSNSVMSYCCSIFSCILGSGENYAHQQWNIIRDQVTDALKSSTLFSIIEQMFESLDKRSKEGIYGVINLLKRLDTFSVEDQELIANTAAYLAKRAEIF